MFPKPDLGHAGTISITVRVRRASWNAMKPRIQGVLTQWKPGSSASGSGCSTNCAAPRPDPARRVDRGVDAAINSRNSGTAHSRSSGTDAAFMPFGPLPDACQTPARRSETGVPLRQNALDPGFHGVPAGPARPERGADGVSVT